MCDWSSKNFDLTRKMQTRAFEVSCHRANPDLDFYRVLLLAGIQVYRELQIESVSISESSKIRFIVSFPLVTCVTC